MKESRRLPLVALHAAGVQPAFTFEASFAPIGYVNAGEAANFALVEFDAALSPLELRSAGANGEASFFDALAARVEAVSAASASAPVVLLGHSVANCVASSFVRWAAAAKGRAWVDARIYSWVAFAAPLLGTAECARRLLEGAAPLPSSSSSSSSATPATTLPSASDAVRALARDAPAAPWLVPRGSWARRTALGSFWLRDESVLRIQIGKVEVQRWAVVHKPTGRDTGDGPALYLEVDVNGSRIACTPVKSYDPVFNFAVQSVLNSEGGSGVGDVAANVVTITLKKRTTVGASTVATAVLDLADLLGPSISAAGGGAGAASGGPDGGAATSASADDVIVAGSGLAAVVGLSSPTPALRAAAPAADAEAPADAAAAAAAGEGVRADGIADAALNYNSATYEGLVSFEGLAIRQQAYGAQQAVAPATMRLSLAWRRSLSGDTAQHVRPSLWASLDEAVSAASVTANPSVAPVVTRFAGPSYLADPNFGGIPATAIPRGREINRRAVELKPMQTEALDTQFALAESDAGPPPLKRVVAVYGVGVPTPVQYAFRHKHMHALRAPGVLAWEPSTTLAGVSGDGVVYESEGCGRLALRVDSGERLPTSGDGVVPYLSLRHAATWHGARALGASQLCNVQVVELQGADHDGVVQDERSTTFLARYLAPTICVEVVSTDLLGSHSAGRKSEQLYVVASAIGADGAAMAAPVRSGLSSGGALSTEQLHVGGFCDVAKATTLRIELCSRLSSVTLASVSIDVAETYYRCVTPNQGTWVQWHDLEVRARSSLSLSSSCSLPHTFFSIISISHRHSPPPPSSLTQLGAEAVSRAAQGEEVLMDGRVQLRISAAASGVCSDGRLVKKLANSAAMGAAKTPAIPNLSKALPFSVEAFDELEGAVVSSAVADDATIRRAFVAAQGGSTQLEAASLLTSALASLGVSDLALVGLSVGPSGVVDPDGVAALTASFSAFAAAFNGAAARVDADLARRFARFLQKKGELRHEAISSSVFIARDSLGAGRLMFDNATVADLGGRMMEASTTKTGYELVVFGPFEGKSKGCNSKVTDAVLALIASSIAKLPMGCRLPYTVISTFETIRAALPDTEVPPYVFSFDASSGKLSLVGGLLELRAFLEGESIEIGGPTKAISRQLQLTLQAALDEAERSCLRYGTFLEGESNAPASSAADTASLLTSALAKG